MKKELLILKRRKAKELHEKGWSNRKIAKYLLASKNSVGKWVQMDESEISTDNRGWEKGKSRKYTPETKQQIINIRKDLENSYFIGSNVVKKNHEAKTDKSVSISFLGKSMMSIDFIGPMYLKGSDNRINFRACKYIRPQKQGMVTRIEGPTTEETITAFSAMNRRLTSRSRILTSL